MKAPYKSTGMVLSVILLLSLIIYAVPVAAAPTQLVKLAAKPKWAGQPGGPSGGNGDDDSTTYVLVIEID
jgi:hypothetical protein